MKPHPTNAQTALEVTEGMAIRQLFADISGRFREEGLASPELDARLILCHGCALTHEQFVAGPAHTVTGAEAIRITAMVNRRLDREPVSRILGMREFRGLPFALGPDVLDPRPDTETLVEAALECIGQDGANNACSILDLGTGTGCILISLLHALPGARGIGVDISPGALAVARSNAKTLGVERRAQFLCSDWDKEVDGTFDLVVSNPPYIPTSEIKQLEPEVSLFDPGQALDGGEDGLAAYRKLVPRIRRLLSPDGWVLFEVGAGQAEYVGRLLCDVFNQQDDKDVRQWRDLTGHIRCVGTKHSPINE